MQLAAVIIPILIFDEEENEMKEEMKQKILALLEKVLPQIDFTSSDALVDDGILDSITIVTMVSELSIEFNVTFDLDELEAENLNSIDAITETVLRLQQ